MKHISALRTGADPFDEHSVARWRRTIRMLGGTFRFSSSDRRLLDLVDSAYAGLPTHRLARARPGFEIRLRCVESDVGLRQPPPLVLSSGGGVLCGLMDAMNFVIVSPAQRTALVSISSAMLAHPYHARYELIEFAVYALAARSQQLVAMHAACVGRGKRGALLIGPSGAGKSTLSLHCLLEGMKLLSEDSVFVSPIDLTATGIGTFLHLRTDDARLPQDAALETALASAAIIRRRSGIEKFELDLRKASGLISPGPLQVSAFVFVSKESATDRQIVTPIRASESFRRLRASQVYAATQPKWKEFLRQAKHVPAFVLRRARDPTLAAQMIAALLESGATSARGSSLSETPATALVSSSVRAPEADARL
jgi:hypothetical protein